MEITVVFLGGNEEIRARMEKNRIEAFSDGVIAIVITLLVLELKVPHVTLEAGEAPLRAALTELFPKFSAYITSFIVLAVWWAAHHQLFSTLKHANRNLLWLNCLFLMWLCLLPFPAALIGDYPNTRTGAFLFGAIATLTAGTFYWMRWYSCRAKLLKPDVPKEAVRLMLRKSLLSPVLHGIGMALSLLFPHLALALYAGIALLFIFPSRLDRHLSS
jgi:uncharacterized membrane protein